MLRVGVIKRNSFYNIGSSNEGGIQMKRPGKVFGGILLILIGVSILLSLIGIHLGGIIGFAIGAWLLYWGYCNWKEKGKWSFSSILLLILGGLILLGGLGGMMSLLIGAALVYGGYRLVKPKQREEDFTDFHLDDIPMKSSTTSTYDTIDEEFAKLMNEK